MKNVRDTLSELMGLCYTCGHTRGEHGLSSGICYVTSKAGVCGCECFKSPPPPPKYEIEDVRDIVKRLEAKYPAK